MKTDGHYDLKRVYIVVFSLLVRAAVLLGTAVALGKPTGVALLVASAAVVLDALAYEALRARTRADISESRIALVSWAVYVVVGLGYVIRVGFGLWLGSGGLQSNVVISSLVCVWLLGIMFVTMTWLLEAGSLTSNHATLATKRHFLPLLRMARLELLSDEDEAARRRPLVQAMDRFGSIWDIAFVGCCGTTAALAAFIAASSSLAAAITVAASIVVAYVATRLDTNDRRFPVALVALLAVPVAILSLDAGAGYVAALLVLPAFTYTLFRRASYGDLFLDPKLLLVGAQVAFDRFALWIAGLQRGPDGAMMRRGRGSA